MPKARSHLSFAQVNVLRSQACKTVGFPRRAFGRPGSWPGSDPPPNPAVHEIIQGGATVPLAGTIGRPGHGVLGVAGPGRRVGVACRGGVVAVITATPRGSAVLATAQRDANRRLVPVGPGAGLRRVP
jgi:hypothetical protein